MQDYGVIGDCRSAELVSSYGSIDFLCWPRFDSPSIFAALLDGRKALTMAKPTPGESE
jgi:GH15 family glucan-1,4-alpha-glucosidase